MVKCINVTIVEIKYVKLGKYRAKNLFRFRQNKARKMHIISIFVTTERHKLKKELASEQLNEAEGKTELTDVCNSLCVSGRVFIPNK